jgi:ATP-binding cassette subfamily B (MDR/TAP) protein 6
LFSILPTIVDIGIAVVYFGVAFDIYFALIVFMTMLLYLVFTIGLTEWRTKFRREMNLMDNESRQKAVDSLINFETVSRIRNKCYKMMPEGYLLHYQI